MSSEAHGIILGIDWSEALQMPGVVDKVDHTDVPGSNLTGHVIKDEEIFASEKVRSLSVSCCIVHLLMMFMSCTLLTDIKIACYRERQEDVFLDGLHVTYPHIELICPTSVSLSFWFLGSNSNILLPINLKFNFMLGHHLCLVAFEIGPFP